MILKKPYAFFIKIFKPIHILISILIGYLIYLNINLFSFFNSYIYNSINVTDELIDKLDNSFLIILPIVLIIVIILILTVLIRKDKKVLFYFINIFLFIVVIIISKYSIKILYLLKSDVIAIKTVKLIHDLCSINICILSVLFVIYVIRGLGINIKKFDFSSDLLKIETDEKDSALIEVKVDIDFKEKKAIRNKKIRYIKYYLIENKFKFILGILGFIFITIIIIFYSVLNRPNVKKENTYIYSLSNGINVYDAIITKNDYLDNIITNNNLVVLSVKIKNNKNLYLNDLSLNIGDTYFKPTLNYCDKFIDLGVCYNDEVNSEFNDYILIYEIDDKYLNSTMYLKFYNYLIKLKTYQYINSNKVLTNKINEEMTIDSLNNIKLNIYNYNIEKYFISEYDFCMNNGECIKSIEYIRPTINQNFDKVVFQLGMVYFGNDSIDSFYELLTNYGFLYYSIDDIWYYQRTNFEEIKPLKSNDDYIYIGVDSKILDASMIKFVFKIRGISYEYELY